MYFYLAKNGRFCHKSIKTEGVKNAQVCVTACFDENYDLIIYDIKRIAGTELSWLLKTINKTVEFALENKSKTIICETNKIPTCYLRKIGFETINGCTLFKVG